MRSLERVSLGPYPPRTTILIYASTALFCLGLTYPAFLSGFEAWDLRDLVKTLKASLFLFAVPLGWLGVWVMMPHSSESVIIGATPSRPRQIILGTQAIVATASIFTGVALGTTPAALTLTLTQYSTFADHVSLLATMVSIASLVPVGFVAASLAGPKISLFSTPLFLAAMILSPAYIINDVLLLNRPASVMSVAYTWSVSFPERGQTLVWQVELFRLFFFLLMGLVSIFAASGLTEWRMSGQTRSLTHLLWMLCPLSVATFAALMQPILVTDDPADNVRCEQSSHVKLCLYQIDETNRALFSKALFPIVELVLDGTGKTAVITQNWDDSTADFWLNRAMGERDTWIRDEIRSLGYGLTFGKDDDCSPANPEGPQLRFSVVRQFLLRAGHRAQSATLATAYREAAAEWFTSSKTDTVLHALSDQELSDWYRENRTPLAMCTLSESEIQ